MGPINTSCDYAYLASPYTKYYLGTEEAYAQAVLITALLMQKGWKVFSPIVHSHPISKIKGIPNTHEFWLAQDYPMLARAQTLIVAKMNGWQESDGVRRELAWADELGIPVQWLEVVE